MHVSVCKRLITERGRQTDIHETDMSYLENCAAAGSFAADHLGWRRLICHEKSAAGEFFPKTKEEIFKELLDIIGN